MNKTLLISLFVVSLFLLAACSETDEHVDDHPHEEGEEHSEVSEVELTGEIKEFEIIARNWEFEPAEIRVNLGDKVELHIQSEDVTHGFMISEFGVRETLEPGVDVHVEFIADKTGVFSFICYIPCGSGHGGMRGQLIVE